jgi:hypothetical protein
MQNNFELPAL